MNGIDAVLLQYHGYCPGFFDRSSPRHQLIPRDPEHYGEITPCLQSDIRQDLQGETQPVHQSPAIFVGPLVGIGGHELGNQISVAAVNLDTVKTRPLRPQGAVAEFLHDLLDLNRRQFMRHLPNRGAGYRGRRNGLRSDHLNAGLAPCMIDLREYGPPDIVNPPGQFRVALYLAVVPQARYVGKTPPFRVHRVILGNDKPPPPPGLRLMVGDVPLGRRPIGVAIVHHHCRHHQPVGDLDHSYPDGRKYVV